ncbi:nucleotidyltransferase domain-containing protein [Vibrio sp. E150_011]
MKQSVPAINNDAQSTPQAHYQPAINDLLSCLKSGLRGNLHSVYIYGSVAYGRAVPGLSNLDVVVVTHQPFSSSELKLLNTINWRFQKDFPFIDGVLIRRTVVSEVASLEALFTWGFLIKQCCMCVLGDDLSECFGDYVPSWEIAKQWNMDIAQALPIVRHRVATAQTQKELLKAQRFMSKKLLRAAYGLVMHKTKIWRDEPKQCGEHFLRYYPDQKVVVERLQILLGPRAIPKRSVVGLLDDFGAWLIKEYKRTEFRIG